MFTVLMMPKPGNSKPIFIFGKVFTTKFFQMKKTIKYLTVVAALLVFSNFVSAQQFTITPEKPVGGEKLSISYTPKGGPLDGEPFDGIAYIYDAIGDPKAMDLNFDKQGDALVAQLTLPAGAKAVLFSFGNDELEKSDNNGGKGYKTLVYQSDRNTAVKGALALKSMFYNGMGRSAGIKDDAEKAFNLANQALAAQPDLLNDWRFARSYAVVATKQKNEEAMNTCKAQIEKISSNKKATEDEFRVAVALAEGLGDKAKGESLVKQAEEKYKNGFYAMNKAFGSFRAAKTLDEKLKIYNDFKSNFSKVQNFELSKNNIAAGIATEYGKQGDWVNFEKYFAQITDRSRQAGVLNSLAWTMSGESLEGEASNPKKGMELSAKSVELMEKEIENPVSRPQSSSEKKYKQNLAFGRAMYSDTYGLLLYKNGDYANAFKYQSIACEQYKFEDGEMNERYMVFFEKNKSAKETEELLAKFIAEGKATSKMSEQHKRIFLANNSLESAYEKYVVSLEKEAKVKKREEIAAKMLDEKAPAFKLRNLKGEEVSLEGLRGKVLVLDFWATWCGPCKASFPGMQMAVNKYADRKDVEFLFIDTWENGDDKAKLAGDFIASKSYTFNVLMDLQNEVVSSFGVSGIPTKFVVDAEGKIRFKSVGFNGNDQELVDELSVMIELAGGRANP